jgi:prostamide/prostaglandin F2alpha synthase
LEELGVEDFVKGSYFDGELYIDLKKACYEELGYKRLGVFGIIGSLMKKKVREAMAAIKRENIKGDMKGDGFQNGGTIIVSAGGKKCLLNFVQEEPSDHVALEDVLKALNIEGAVAEEQGATARSSNVACDEDVCTMRK